MKQEILITLDANEKRVAILQEGRLEEFYIERAGEPRLYGNVYKARVKSVVPGIGASFLDLGTKKDGFLYVMDALKSPLDLETEYGDSPSASNDHDNRSKRIEDVLKVGQEVQDEWRVDLLQVKIRWRYLESCARVFEQELEGVGVRVAGVHAGSPV